MNFNKRISTKGLYIALLVKCNKYNINNCYDSYYEFDPIAYILVKEKIDILDTQNKYVDIFTKNKYTVVNEWCKDDKIYIRNLIPCSSNKKYITYDEATKVLQYRNPMFLDLSKINNSKDKQKVFSKK